MVRFHRLVKGLGGIMLPSFYLVSKTEMDVFLFPFFLRICLERRIFKGEEGIYSSLFNWQLNGGVIYFL